MNRNLEMSSESPDEIDVGGIALVGLLVGAIFVLAGVFSRHPVLRSMAEAYNVKASLTTGQTLFVGVGVLAISAAVYIWSKLSSTKRG